MLISDIAPHELIRMHKLLLLGLSALLFCTIAHGIVCNVCNSGNGKVCYSKVEFCKTDTGKCYTYAGYIDNELYYVSYNCIDNDYWTWYCNKTEKDERYTHVQTCCETDKCNGEIPRLPWS